MNMMGLQGTIDSEDGEPQNQKSPVVRQIFAGEKVGCNDPCPCGSGKKYKHCHGKNA